ncbi:MAG: porin family protein [Alphaproteobacteria bacterium]|jgi:hypothetical protein|nr:porin family protein [Alphaproteobacteria bacterium]
MKNIIIILFIILSPTLLKAASGFYIGGGYGHGIAGNSNININNIGFKDSYSETKNILKDEIVSADNDNINPENDGKTRTVINTTINTNYSGILKSASYNKAIKNTAYAISGGWAFKNIRMEIELRNTVLQIQPKTSVLDVGISQDWKSLITSYCIVGNQQVGSNNTCINNGNKVDDPATECAEIYDPKAKNPVCYINNITMSGSTSTSLNNVIMDENSALSFKIDPIDINNYLGFMNFIYELPINQKFTLFSSFGLGYGSSAISNNFVKQSVVYPVYQYKIGTYYSISKHIDITIDYSNINMLGTVKKTDLIVKDTRIQSINFGIRYNFFKREPAFYQEYNYKKIFQFP